MATQGFSLHLQRLISYSALHPQSKQQIDLFFHNLQKQIVENWDMFEKVMDYVYIKSIKSESNLHPEVAWVTQAKREQLTEIMLEKHNVPAFFLCKNPVLSAFANGRSTARIEDSGATQTSAVLLYDGYVISQYIVKSHLAGDFVLAESKKLMEELGIDIVHHKYMIARKNSDLLTGARNQDGSDGIMEEDLD